MNTEVKAKNPKVDELCTAIGEKSGCLWKTISHYCFKLFLICAKEQTKSAAPNLSSELSCAFICCSLAH